MHRFAACLLACPLVYLPMLTPRAVPHVAIVFLACLAMLAVWAEMERRAARLRAGTE
jgi:hypothetical protein